MDKQQTTQTDAEARTRMNAKQRKAAEKARKAALPAKTIEAREDEHGYPGQDENGNAPIKPVIEVKAPKLTKTGLPRLPAIKRQRKPKPARPCSCGCGGETKGGRFIPGHDSRLKGWLLRIERKIVTLDQIPEGERAAVLLHLNPVKESEQ